MANPIISIIVPCYNQAQYLPETLQSVLKQSLQNWECIIVNDGSPDNTEEVALEWCGKDARFKYQKKENGGIASARNYGIEHSTGKYILPLDSDDLISEDYAKEAVEVLDTDPSVKIVFARAELFGELNGEWDLLPYSYTNELFIRNCIHCSAVFRRSDYDKTTGYNSNMKKGWEDYDFYLSLLEPDDKVFKIDKVHFYYRIKEVSRNAGVTESIEAELRLQLFRNHQEAYLKYMDPIEMYRQLRRLELIEQSTQYKVGGMVLAPLRCLLKIFKRKG
ncbi:MULTISPECIES: glycosyltransferase family A protein [unclassified Dysgonomonas]|uniref:glycosyltransferase family 2 protein n=1 Tax=unclassified Dysgonomonas TaxID=2630389 RepID=UPI002476BDED|nr:MULTISPECIES: glycosyltransferase family A protein [unclassified Dysgonomonas]